MSTPEMRKMVREVDEIIAMGWLILRRLRQQSGAHLTDKELFFAGASYLFDALMAFLDKDFEPTEDDLMLMAKLADELTKFTAHFNSKVKGNANPTG